MRESKPRRNSPAWLEHIQKANAALGSLTPEKMSNLRPGEAFIWSSKPTDEAFTKGAVKIRCRPRVTHHGGATKTAVGTPRLDHRPHRQAQPLEKLRHAGRAGDVAPAEAMAKAMAAQLDKESSVLFGTARLWDDGIIDPRDTRRVLELCLNVCAEGRAFDREPLTRPLEPAQHEPARAQAARRLAHRQAPALKGRMAGDHQQLPETAEPADEPHPGRGGAAAEPFS